MKIKKGFKYSDVCSEGTGVAGWHAANYHCVILEHMKWVVFLHIRKADCSVDASGVVASIGLDLLLAGVVHWRFVV
jgi:hypothetical protein